MTTNTDACSTEKPVRVRRKPRDMSWFPECGIERVWIEFDHDPSIVATMYGNALVEANLDCSVPFLFRREGTQATLLYAGRDDEDAHVVIRPLNAEVLRSMLHEVAAYGFTDAEGRRKYIAPGNAGWPSTIVPTLMTRLANDPGIPMLKMLVTSPVLTKDGWLEETSYSAESGILSRLDPAEWHPLTTFLGNEVQVAAAMIRDLFRETKIANPAALSMLIGSMVSIIARPLFKNVPMIVHASGDFGTGKTATMVAINVICLAPGESTLVSCADFDGTPAEMEKRISDALTSLSRHVMLDDPKEGVQFNHTDLATLLTSPYVDIRTFGRLGGPNSKTRVRANQSVSMSANNPDLSPRFNSRTEEIAYETGLADNRKVPWGRRNYEAFVAENRRDYNWAIRTLVDEAHRILAMPAKRAQWEAWMDDVVASEGARGNFREWYIYTAVVSDLLGVDAKKYFSSRVEYEAPTDSEAELRSALVRRLIALGATDAAKGVSPGALMPGKGAETFADWPWETPEAVSAYLRNHARGKAGMDDEGRAWLVCQGNAIKKRPTWMVKRAIE